MTTFSPLRETLLKALLKAALAGYHHLSAHFQKVKAEMTELSDHDLFEETKRYPALHLRCLLASFELMQRGYYLSEIRDVRNDP
ncbi:hypothetical protein FLL67_09850 [Vibrio cholerae]|uniref:hypothetical protein n=1 Tax=Vibrio cholerae TaxID=666 RepID=UPI00115C5DF4|nr:hypothetical protein [Vibrio cholerae]EGR2424946.1 hypothetical protein [Vibrio cholerae]MVC79837.1 hypothetical protein [Vibrio cholerae]TQQ30240.1 hypothetical protein FLL67_09850 [Vibrio cholerae]TXZ70895.1 hypothetical protein FXE20_11950 [Vibrio cholerae]GHZ73122.1 Hypothetical protein VCSRO34_0385 [Vibrio cholerae]